jgi:hypothetical protein
VPEGKGGGKTFQRASKLFASRMVLWEKRTSGLLPDLEPRGTVEVNRRDENEEGATMQHQNPAATNQAAIPEILSKYIGKLLLFRGARDVTCKVFPPTGNGGAYPAMLEKGAISEQFFLNPRDVDLFARTGSDINLSSEVRTALRNLDRRYQKKMAGRH